LTRDNLRLNEQIKYLRSQSTEREQIYSNEKNQYEKRLKDLSKRPLMTCVKLQTVKFVELFVFFLSDSFFFEGFRR